MYSLHSPNVCTSLIVTNESRKSWGLVVGGGHRADTSQIHLETESRWSSGQFCCQESFLSLLISENFFFPLVDVLIMTVLTGEAPTNWEDWVPVGYGWVCAVIAAPTMKYEAAPKTINMHLVYRHFRVLVKSWMSRWRRLCGVSVWHQLCSQAFWLLFIIHWW